MQKFLHKSAFLGMLASLDGIKIKVITIGNVTTNNNNI